MYSSKLSVSVHILCVIDLYKNEQITSETIAESIQTNPAIVRRLLSNLKKAGLIRIQTKLGVKGLTRPISDITLKEIFQAVEPQTKLVNIHTDTNIKCQVGANIQTALDDVYSDLQEQFMQHLHCIKLSDVMQKMSLINEFD